MRKYLLTLSAICAMMAMSCQSNENANAGQVQATASEPTVGQSGVQDDASDRNVVQVAIASKDHSTLVAAVKAANLVDALSNAGPFTVFAPTNAAFDKLPKGTVDGLLKPEKKNELSDILEYHVSLGVFKPEQLVEGLDLGQVNGGRAVIREKDGKKYINDAQIIASVPAANGIVHVIDAVLLPK